MKKIAIVDYGLANIRSVVNALNCFDVDLTIAETGDGLAEADGIILPGVGSFDAGMSGLRERGHEEALTRLVMEGGRPFFGICLGMQFLFEGSAEGSEQGFGWLPGALELFDFGKGGLKVPHMGWSDLDIRMENGLFRDLVPPHTYYFLHSYYLPFNEVTLPVTSATCTYGESYAAAVEKDNIVAVQFHPEKSQLAGMKLLENFLGMI